MLLEKKYNLVISIFFVSFFLFPGCSSEEISYIEISKTDTVTSADYDVFQLVKSGNTEVTYNLDIGSSPRDVYFIFTNTNAGKKKTSPSISTDDSRLAADTESSVEDPPVTYPVALRGKPEITMKNSEVLNNFNLDNSRRVDIFDDILSRSDAEGDDGTLYIDNTSEGLESVEAHCRYRKVDLETGKIVNIWVADNCWDGYRENNPGASDVKSYEINSAMLESLGQKFFSGADGVNDNDIYTWVTDMYGYPWGTHDYNNLIPATDEITILFTDIDNDNINFISDGGVAGFFYAAHNRRKSSLFWSNERVMFFIDAVMFAYNDSGAWSISEFWPSETISTLVHEFQHMIHFYQKVIRRNSGEYTDTWIDEMMAMATEDLLSNAISTTLNVDITGPRGIVGSSLSAGSSGNPYGRLPWYTGFHPVSLTDFYLGINMDDILKSYGASYSFGAYLIRNYGGAAVLKAIMENPYPDYRAIADATGIDVETDAAYAASKARFGDLMRKHGTASLLSDYPISIDGLKYNTGDSSGFTDSSGYTIGSINMFNYFLYTDNVSGTFESRMYEGTCSGGSMPPASQTFVMAGKNLTGNRQWTIKLVDGVEMDVIIK